MVKPHHKCNVCGWHDPCLCPGNSDSLEPLSRDPERNGAVHVRVAEELDEGREDVIEIDLAENLSGQPDIKPSPIVNPPYMVVMAFHGLQVFCGFYHTIDEANWKISQWRSLHKCYGDPFSVRPSNEMPF